MGSWGNLSVDGLRTRILVLDIAVDGVEPEVEGALISFTPGRDGQEAAELTVD